ncbi:MAG: DegV family protein [Oscillospiraceae bacterium]|nr:DegV family protein [Oscillospiraceae bacterium]
MFNYILSCCSTADLSKEHFEERDIKYICFHYKLNGVDYPDDLGQSIPFEEFYKRMESGEDTRTSQINVTEYLEYFSRFLEEGKDIIHLTLSSGISGSYNSAVNAAKIAKERYPERKIYIVDSLAASSGYGLLMDKLADLRDGGMDIDELRDWAEENKLNLHHWFFSSDLKFFIKGGRVSKTSGTIGTILGICPLLNVSFDGHLIARSKIRSKKKVIQEIVKRMEENAEGGLSYSGKCYISQSACVEDAKEVAKLVEERFPNLDGRVIINYVGTTIGSHTGPGTVALFFWGKKRED